MDNHNDHDQNFHCKEDFKVGDKVYCEKNKMNGFVSRLNPLGCIKMFAIGVHWEDKTRGIIFGKEECCLLKKI